MPEEKRMTKKEAEELIESKIDQMIKCMDSGESEAAMRLALDTKKLAKDYDLPARKAEARMNVGAINLQWGNMDEAKKCFKKGLKYDADTLQKTMLEANLGAIYIQQGKLNKAIEHTQKAIEHAPDPQMKFSLSRQLENIKTMKKAGSGVVRYRLAASVHSKRRK